MVPKSFRKALAGNRFMPACHVLPFVLGSVPHLALIYGNFASVESGSVAEWSKALE